VKVSAFVGSPRKKGNSSLLAQQFLAGAKAAGAQTNQFFLAGHNINPCQGCYQNCMIKPGTICKVHRDDMDLLLEELISSDLVLFASPLYCASFTSIMGCFFERCLPLIEVEVIGEKGTPEGVRFIANPARGKKAVVALVQDLKNPAAGDLAFQVFEHTVGRTYMMNIVEKIHVTDVRDVGDIKGKTEALASIFEIGKGLSHEI